MGKLLSQDWVKFSKLPPLLKMAYFYFMVKLFELIYFVNFILFPLSLHLNYFINSLLSSVFFLFPFPIYPFLKKFQFSYPNFFF